MTEGAGMLAEILHRLLEVGWPITALLVYVFIAGLPWRVLARRVWGINPRPSSVMLVGLALTSVLIGISHAASVPVRWVVPVLVVAGAASAVISVITSRRRATVQSGGQSDIWKTEVVSLAAVTTVFAPVIRFGATYWTLWVNDFPSYVAYAQSWLDETPAGLPYLDVHSDPAGVAWAERGEFDKPLLTAFMIAATQVTRMPVYRLETPLLLLIAYLTVSAFATLIVARFRMAWLTSVALVAIPGLSLLVMSRFFDFHGAQVLAISFVAGAMAIAATIRSAPSVKAQALGGASVGLLVGAALGSHFPVVLAGLPAIIVVLLLIWAPAAPTRRLSAVFLTSSATTALAVNLPLAERHVANWNAQTTGAVGVPMTLPSPLAAIGQEVVSLSLPPSQFFWSWSLVIIGAFIAMKSLKASRSMWRAAFVLTAVVTASVIALAWKVGPENYAFHKLLVFLIAVLGPVAVAGVYALFERSVGFPRWAVIGLAATSVLFTVLAASRIWIVVPRDLISLDENPVLAGISTINIDLGNYYEDSIAAAVVPVDRVVVIGGTYAEGGDPVGEWWLIRSDQANSRSWAETIPLDDFYSLARSHSE